MPINFHAEENRTTYTNRTADLSWEKAMYSIVEPSGLNIVDLGCGGGIYAKAWVKLGASSVIGVDSSQTMLDAAAAHCRNVPEISFLLGDALATGLASESADLVFERALIHHISNLQACFREAYRVLKPGGRIIVQDRTPEDVAIPGTQQHIRGYFFECFPNLLHVETKRRPAASTVLRALADAGFYSCQQQHLWETRKVYETYAELESDLRKRTGRSILHELTDVEISKLIAYIQSRLTDDGNQVVERDRWTVYTAVKPEILSS